MEPPTTAKIEKEILVRFLDNWKAFHRKTVSQRRYSPHTGETKFIRQELPTALATYRTTIEKEVAEEIISEIDSLPHGHTPDGKTHWVSIHDEDLEKLRHRYGLEEGRGR